MVLEPISPRVSVPQFEAAREDVDVLQAPVGGVGRPGQQRHVGPRGIDDRLEDVVGEVARAKRTLSLFRLKVSQAKLALVAGLATRRPPERTVIPETVPLLG